MASNEYAESWYCSWKFRENIQLIMLQLVFLYIYNSQWQRDLFSNTKTQLGKSNCLNTPFRPTFRLELVCLIQLICLDEYYNQLCFNRNYWTLH